jgi:hypothetical protein
MFFGVDDNGESRNVMVYMKPDFSAYRFKSLLLKRWIPITLPSGVIGNPGFLWKQGKKTNIMVYPVYMDIFTFKTNFTDNLQDGKSLSLRDPVLLKTVQTLRAKVNELTLERDAERNKNMTNIGEDRRDRKLMSDSKRDKSIRGNYQSGFSGFSPFDNFRKEEDD